MGSLVEGETEQKASTWISTSALFPASFGVCYGRVKGRRRGKKGDRIRSDDGGVSRKKKGEREKREIGDAVLFFDCAGRRVLFSRRLGSG